MVPPCTTRAETFITGGLHHQLHGAVSERRRVPGRAAFTDPGSETEARPMLPTAPEVSKVHRSPSTTE